MREKHRLVVSLTCHGQGLAHNPGMCPDSESNQQTFALQDDAQPTELHLSGHHLNLFSPRSDHQHHTWGIQRNYEVLTVLSHWDPAHTHTHTHSLWGLTPRSVVDSQGNLSPRTEVLPHHPQGRSWPRTGVSASG